MGKVRVLVVEDSLTVRKRLVEVLTTDPQFEVVGEASDGEQAIALCLAKRPNVITMDMMLPNVTGLAATEYIMAHCPTPILIVSSSLNRGELFTTYDALAAGAVDVCEKPRGDEDPRSWERRFLNALRVASRVHVITHFRARLRPRSSAAVATRLPATAAVPITPAGHRLVAIGVSTGGPSALVEVLGALPRSYPLPVLIVMHVSTTFAPMFTDWLTSQLQRDVAYARPGESLERLHGAIRFAPPDVHLVVQHGELQLSHDPERHSCRPSVDVLFESLVKPHPEQVVACLLTGMGRDGAAGLLALRRAGALTIAQDEATSAVYGMPREAVELGAAMHVLPLPQIGKTLAGLRASQERAKAR
ncbi:MAG: chemotaxis-specific protein-glutamate methyltransferase CheB [Polyangiales bacterium]